MDVWREGDQAGIMLSSVIGIFYFRVAKSAEGNWKPLWQQEIRGATGASANNRTIVLTGLSTVTFTRADDSASVFELTEASIKKDGKEYNPLGELVCVSVGRLVAVPVRDLSAEGARKICLIPRTGVYLEIEASGTASFQWGSSPEDHFPFKTDGTAIAALIEAVKADSQDTPASGSEGIQLYLYATGDSPQSPGFIPPGKRLKAKMEEFLDLIRQSERGPRLKELLSTNSLYQG